MKRANIRPFRYNKMAVPSSLSATLRYCPTIASQLTTFIESGVKLRCFPVGEGGKELINIQ